MKKILSRAFYLLKYILLIFAFALVLYGIIRTYQRLEKSLLESIPVFIPFALLLITYFVNLFFNKPVIKDNLFYNLTSVLALSVIIIIGLRAMLDSNMLLYHKYQINYNPLYFSDNLSSIKLMLYCLIATNVILMVSTVFDKDENKKLKSNTKEK